ncbi:hypothetical protein BV898_12686 [Hypsibius exemplaris]|uniref:Uncharacterized protein n=1 Tax=Hypsibius exemplaris TaxID=2072580 RepID=A0A1W0WCY3_HYPEX|nr:hypothetical protein BV898_12686 [Hypsibius exemplaris]
MPRSKKKDKKGKKDHIEFPLLTPQEILYPSRDAKENKRNRGYVSSKLAQLSPKRRLNKIKLRTKPTGAEDLDALLMSVYNETFQTHTVAVPADQTDPLNGGPKDLLNGGPKDPLNGGSKDPLNGGPKDLLNGGPKDLLNGNRLKELTTKQLMA